MIRHGNAPYLECSTAGDKRFSAFHARVIARDFHTIEHVYQSSKRFSPDTPGVDHTGRIREWRHAKGLRAINQDAVTPLYARLWLEYLHENPELIHILSAASGLSDQYGQPGHTCQATVLWALRHHQAMWGYLPSLL